MKLYDGPRAPSSRRVRIFLAEKGIEVPIVPVDLGTNEQRDDAFLAKNPRGKVPVLELDDGTCISESVAICRYFEELHPQPALMGEGALDRALVEMWQRRMELNLLRKIFFAFRHKHVFFKDRLVQVPEFGKVCKEEVVKELAAVNENLAERSYIAGETYTIADITALTAIDFARVLGIRLGPEHGHLQRWHQAVSARPSASA